MHNHRESSTATERNCKRADNVELRNTLWETENEISPYPGRVRWVTLCAAVFICLPISVFSQTLSEVEVNQVRALLDKQGSFLSIFLQYFLAPIAILISTVAASVIAITSINVNRDINKKRATFDYLSRLSWDDDWLSRRQKYLELKAGEMKLSAIAQRYEKAKNAEGAPPEDFHEILESHSAIIAVLNEYEAMAVGISTETLSEEIIERTMRQTIIDTVLTCRDFIDVTRRNGSFANPSAIYQECEALVHKWQNGKQKSSSKRRKA